MAKISLLFGGLLVAFSLQAETVLFDSTTTPPYPSGQIPAPEDPIQGGLGPLYASFSTGVNFGVLSNLELVLDTDGTDTGNTGSISVDLFADSTSCPSSTTDCVGGFIANLATIGDASLVSGGSLIGVSLASNPSLNSGTRYWIGLTGTGTDGYWVFNSDTNGVGVNPDGVPGDPEFIQNSGGTFADNPDGPYEMEVEVTQTTPEPSTLFLCTSTLVALALRRRRT
jgi:hypothetical protein